MVDKTKLVLNEECNLYDFVIFHTFIGLCPLFTISTYKIISLFLFQLFFFSNKNGFPQKLTEDFGFFLVGIVKDIHLATTPG